MTYRYRERPAKLTVEAESTLREMAKLGLTKKVMALQFGVHKDTIRHWLDYIGVEVAKRPTDKPARIRILLEQGYPAAYIAEAVKVSTETVRKVGPPAKTEQPPPNPPFDCKIHHRSRYWLSGARGWQAKCDECGRYSTVDLGRNIGEEAIAKLFRGRRFRDRVARRQPVRI